MAKVKIGDKEKEVNQKTTLLALSKEFCPEAIAAKVNGKLVDLNTIAKDGSEIEFIDFHSEEGREIFRHSAAHVLASAVKKIFPKAKLTIGPSIEDGFYYDFDNPTPFTPEDLKKIEEEMHNIVKQDILFERLDVSKEEAKNKMIELDEPYKVELINDLGDEQVSLYKHGEFIDLCKGPHVPSTGRIKAFKLTKLAGAYWKGDSSNKMLQRVYGVAFPTKEELKDYISILEEAERRDHRKIGKQLKLFSFHDEGPGFVFWLPKGLFIFNKLIEFWRTEHEKAGYVEIKTPIILSRKLWEQSGHWDNYKENMYFTKIDNQDFAIKPMNCPGGMLVYKEEVHSYKELPLRVGEIGLVHRHELSGVLSGLFRVRQFHQDDAHIFMTKEQVKNEIYNVLQLVEKFYSLFGLSYHIELSTRPAKSIGTDEQWEIATSSLKAALDESGRPYKINEGDGAFYGPKIDFHIRDAIGRTWQCGTIQLDMSLPERFDLTYVDKDGQNIHRPIMIHRVIYGAIERFIGILIEHYAGKFPLWLSPVQVRIITVSNKYDKYGEEVFYKYKSAGIRIELDTRAESVSKKIREAQIEKINYILVVGEKEALNNAVNVRTRDNVIEGLVDSQDFLIRILNEISTMK
ncbi:MAG: threonine--tRNA ligase [Candidatus Woesearchaeota archaeon]